jgi:hypothetical protein
MAMSTRNTSTRRVLPAKEMGMDKLLYPRVRYWAKSFTHRVRGYGHGCTLPVPVYPWVRNTRKNSPAILLNLAHVAQIFGPSPSEHC